MDEKFIIQGGRPLKGEVKIRGAKNAAFPIIAASLLTKEDCFIDNIPLIEDVFKMLEIMENIGAKVTWLGERKIKLNCKDIDPLKLPFNIISRLRGSVLILGPLLARFKEIKIVSPGGCVIGSRPIDTHLDALSQSGVKIEQRGRFFYFNAKKEKEGKTEIVLSEFSVTATENILLFSSLKDKETILKIADEDYQVQELINVLIKMGAQLKSLGCHSFRIKGKRNLKGFSHKIIPDPIEAGTFIVASLITKGKVLVKNAGTPFLTLFLRKLEKSGAVLKVLKDDSVKVFPSSNLKIEKIQSSIYPGIHSDLQPVLGVFATQCKGPTLIHDPLYEGRLKYLEGLNKMGADIVFCDPHRAIVNGPSQLYRTEIPSLDLRAGAALVIAGLAAKGKSILNNIYQIDRGYEKIEERLLLLGAEIKRQKETNNE